MERAAVVAGDPGGDAVVESNGLLHALLRLNRLQWRPQNGGTDDGAFGRRSSAAVVLPAMVGAPDAFRSPWTVRVAAPVEESSFSRWSKIALTVAVVAYTILLVEAVRIAIRAAIHAALDQMDKEMDNMVLPRRWITT